MRLVIDTSAILSVVLNQGPKDKIVSKTENAFLIAPSSLHWEIGSALSSLIKRKVLSEKEAIEAINEYLKIPIQFEDVDLRKTMSLIQKHKIYAYDAYMIHCAMLFRLPLLTLDASIISIAEKEKIQTLEL